MASPLRDASAHTPHESARPTRNVDRGATPASRAQLGLTDLSLLLMALIWGVNFSVVKYGTTVIDPLAYNAVRVALAAVSLVLIAHIFARGDSTVAGWPARRDALALVGLGALGNGLYQAFFVEGVARTRASDAALVIAATPAFIALFGRMRGVERISRRGMLGIALSIAGIALVVAGTADEGAARRATLIGDLLILAGALCWAVFAVFLQPYTQRIGGLHLSALTMVGGMIPLLAIAAPALSTTHWRTVPALAWVAITYSGLGALVIAYLFWYHGVRVLGPTRTAMYSNVQPVFAVLAAWIVLGEVPTALQSVGAVSILTGLVLTRA
jgi:drug/metabolite transporter (DMT)-like permease